MSRRPRYLELAALLRRQVAKGRYGVGDQLPTEHQLCADYEVSRHTARAALQVLEDQGLIERRPGRGTSVISTGEAAAFTQPLGGLDDLLQYAHEAKLAMTDWSRTALNQADASRLGAATGSKWLRIEGVRRIGARAIAATTIFVSEEIGAKPADLNHPDRAVTEHIESRFGVSVATIGQNISAGSLSKKDALLLSEKPGGPVLRTVRRYYDAAGRLFVISDSRHPADRFSYEMSFRRAPVK
jgi:DNA-binding GntR family transcriptional regulator